mgnify:CR=1 FL=1
MIYWAQSKHSRRTYSPGFVLPETHDHRKHPLFQERPVRLPEERFNRVPSIYPFRTKDLMDPATFPAWIRFETPEKEVQDFYKMYSWFIVSARVKDKISELEPDVHQFIPIRLLQKDGSQPWGQYYVFHIRRHIFSIDEAKSPYYKWKSKPGLVPTLTFFDLTRTPEAVPDKKYSFENVHFVYKADTVGQNVIWREVLHLDGPPNTGTRCVTVFPSDGTLRMGDRDPNNPSVAVYMIEEEYGFRVAEVFKQWMDRENVKGLDCSRFPGVLDTDLA